MCFEAGTLTKLTCTRHFRAAIQFYLSYSLSAQLHGPALFHSGTLVWQEIEQTQISAGLVYAIHRPCAAYRWRMID